MNFRCRETHQQEINITPLVDVVFLLLIFFMVSTTFQKDTQLQIRLPEAETLAEEQPPDSIIIGVGAEGDYAVGDHVLANNRRKTLRSALEGLVQGDREVPIIIRADQDSPHGAVVQAMDVVARMGFAELSIAAAWIDDQQ